MGSKDEFLTHPEEGLVYACPHCDKAGDIYVRTGNGNATTDNPNDPYLCRKCRQSFTDPVERATYAHQRNAKYAHLSLEDVGLEPHPPEGTGD